MKNTRKIYESDKKNRTKTTKNRKIQNSYFTRIDVYQPMKLVSTRDYKSFTIKVEQNAISIYRFALQYYIQHTYIVYVYVERGRERERRGFVGDFVRILGFVRQCFLYSINCSNETWKRIRFSPKKIYLFWNCFISWLVWLLFHGLVSDWIFEMH